jgi:hypothetical protein
MSLRERTRPGLGVIEPCLPTPAKVPPSGPGWLPRNLRDVIAAVHAERRAKVAAAYRQKLIAAKKKRQFEKAKREMELDHNLIVIAALIIALPIIAALAWMLTALAVGNKF